MRQAQPYLGILLIAFLLVACAGANIPNDRQTRTAAPTTGLTRLDIDVGKAPAVGWTWVPAVLKTGPEKTDEKLDSHVYMWAFFVIKGSMEVGTQESKKTITAGNGILVAAGQRHTHSYLPNSHILAVQLRPNDTRTPPKERHGGTALSVPAESPNVAAGREYKLRFREFTLSPGQHVSEDLTLGPNFGYVQEGKLTVSKEGNSSIIEPGQTFSLSPTGQPAVSNEGAIPVLFVLVDVH